MRSVVRDGDDHDGRVGDVGKDLRSDTSKVKTLIVSTFLVWRLVPLTFKLNTSTSGD